MTGVVHMALWWIGGVLLGSLLPWHDLWHAAAVALGIVALAMLWWRRQRAARCWAMLGLVGLSAGWTALSLHRLPPDHIAAFLDREPQLAFVRGVVESPPLVRQPQGGAFADFSYEAPRTTCELRLTAVQVEDRWQSCSGRLLLRISAADPTLRQGDAIEAHGWLAPFEGPANPGEWDARKMYAQRGIDARISLPACENRRVITASSASLWRKQLTDAAAAALRAGMETDAERMGLLERLLLGRYGADIGDLSESFRRVGLAHLLSISGAHLMILMGLIWSLSRLLTIRPSTAGWLQLAVLAMFLLVVPPQTPIVRSGIMAGLFAIGLATGRRVAVLETLALATIIVLIWRPGDLFDAGFQLSYGTVAALILFTKPTGRIVWRPPQMGQADNRWARRLADIVAANAVAFLVVSPVVAYHFQMITPLAMLLSLIALPIVTLVLGLGYAKLAVGLVWPALGQWLAAPLAWTTDLMIALVRDAATWPGSVWELPRPPSLLWVAAALAVVLAILTGWASRRKKAVACAAGLCVAWLAFGTMPLTGWGVFTSPDPLRLDMLSVGDGSCFLLQLGSSRGRPHVLMFDCGSLQHWTAGERTIAPALAHLGVRQIDTLVVSHADMDHFNGVLDLADAVPIGRVLIAPHMLAEAEAEPHSIAAFLIDGLRQRSVSIEVVHQGWRQLIGEATLSMIWPPTDFAVSRANDASLVLSIETANRRVLLCGDIQQEAIERLLASNIDLRADVCDLPHHGSFVAASPRFLEKVKPEIALQSSGPARLRDDPWPAALEHSAARRYVTARDGMVSVRIETGGRIRVQTFQ